jgi:hypothetical protein
MELQNQVLLKLHVVVPVEHGLQQFSISRHVSGVAWVRLSYPAVDAPLPAHVVPHSLASADPQRGSRGDLYHLLIQAVRH